MNHPHPWTALAPRALAAFTMSILIAAPAVEAQRRTVSAPVCVRATRLWSDGFESGDHRRWTSNTYFEDWGDGCQSTAVTTARAHSGRFAQRSEVVCPSSSPEGVHRGYGALQFDGPRVMAQHTNQGQGLDAPHGIVTSFWTWLDAPYSFAEGRWLSLFTVNPSCDYTDRVVTLGLDQADGVLRAAHDWPEATQTLAPSLPDASVGSDHGLSQPPHRRHARLAERPERSPRGGHLPP